MQQKVNSSELMGFEENGIGHCIRMSREARGYSQLDICDGICSIATLSLIEDGKEKADYWTLEALLDRMRVNKTEYDFFLDDDTFALYKIREAIKLKIKKKECEEAEKKLAVYQEKYGEGNLHRQFLFLQEAYLERTKPESDKDKKKELFQKAIAVTAPNYKEIFEKKGALSNLELECIAEIIHCTESPEERELECEALYKYFQWNGERDRFFPPAYRIAMQYYAETLYENGKFEDCMRICNEVLEELYGTSKVENRAQIFLLRAKSREGKGIENEEEKKLCLRDYMTAYTVISIYDGKEEAKDLKEYIVEKYGWHYIV